MGRCQQHLVQITKSAGDMGVGARERPAGMDACIACMYGNVSLAQYRVMMIMNEWRHWLG